MKADEELIRKAVDAIDDVPAKRRGKCRSHTLALIEDYRAACDLSRGPDEGRSHYYERKARRLEGELRMFLGVVESTSENCRCGA